MARSTRLRRTFHTSPETLLRLRAVLLVATPAIVVLLGVVVIADLLGVGGPRATRYLRWAGYAVVGFVVLELAVDYRLYRDKSAFLRDRWLDLALVLPLLVLLHVGVWLGGLVLAGRSILILELLHGIGFEWYAIEELTAAGSRLQRALKFTRRLRRLIRPDPAPR